MTVSASESFHVMVDVALATESARSVHGCLVPDKPSSPDCRLSSRLQSVATTKKRPATFASRASSMSRAKILAHSSIRFCSSHLSLALQSRTGSYYDLNAWRQLSLLQIILNASDHHVKLRLTAGPFMILVRTGARASGSEQKLRFISCRFMSALHKGAGEPWASAHLSAANDRMLSSGEGALTLRSARPSAPRKGASDVALVMRRPNLPLASWLRAGRLHGR